MFADTALIYITAGRGGDGAVSFRREIYVDKGGPDGGDGGRGGDVVFRAVENLNTLGQFRYKQEIKAKNGESGAKRRRHGKSAEDLIVNVPVGTVIKRLDGNKSQVIADLDVAAKQAVVASGGDGGFGNAHFKSSTRQAPRIREVGEPGETFAAELELKLVADVGLIGFPNAGKSTLLSVVTNAKPEIADYAFTTLTPNLGVADIDEDSLLLADIPGLIEGAADGKGLGDEFLRHVERTAVLLHLIDAYSDDLAAKYRAIRGELASYSTHLAQLPEVVAVTKTEGMDKEMLNDRLSQLQAVVEANTSLFAISSQAHQNLDELLRELSSVVEAERTKQPATEASIENLPVISLSDKQQQAAWSVEQVDDKFIIYGTRLEKFARQTDFNSPHSLNRLRDILQKQGVVHELIRQGADNTSQLEIAGHSFTMTEV